MLYIVLTIGILMVVISFIAAVLNITSASNNIDQAFKTHGFCIIVAFFGMVLSIGSGIFLIINFIQSLNQTTL